MSTTNPKLPVPASMSALLRLAIWLGIILTVGLFLYLLAPVLTPFLAAALLAYLGDPVTDRLQKFRISRTSAVIIVFVTLLLGLLLLFLLFVPLLEGQVSAMLRRLPGYLDLLQERGLPWLHEKLGMDTSQYDLVTLRDELVKHMQALGGVVGGLLRALSSSSLVLLEVLVNLILIPVITFYLLRDWDGIISKLHTMLPRRLEPAISSLVGEADSVLGAFMKGQLLVMLALGLIYSVGLMIIGLDFALLIGMSAGIVSFVPYLGLIVGLSAATIAALVQYQELFAVLPVLIVFGIGQAAETVALTPLFVGDKIGLHPVAVIFAVLAGGQLFGFFGILLALPAAAVIMVVLRRAYGHYLESDLYQN